MYLLWKYLLLNVWTCCVPVTNVVAAWIVHLGNPQESHVFTLKIESCVLPQSLVQTVLGGA